MSASPVKQEPSHDAPGGFRTAATEPSSRGRCAGPRRESSSFVKRVKLEDIAGKRDVSGPVEALPVPEEAKTDITIFRIKTAAKVTPGHLTAVPPAKGESIWLVSTVSAEDMRRAIAAALAAAPEPKPTGRRK